jgi:hypothetical protein
MIAQTRIMILKDNVSWRSLGNSRWSLAQDKVSCSPLPSYEITNIRHTCIEGLRVFWGSSADDAIDALTMSCWVDNLIIDAIDALTIELLN